MARIRTIKPEFFRHLELYKSEIETKLPLRVAFAGLWTACDREGRFKWIPEELKLDCLPYDSVEFSRVLDALWSRGFIEKYQHDNRIFGFIPSWEEHQYVNNRESESILPNPLESEILTRDGRVLDASETCTSGKERKGKERKVYSPDIILINEFCKKYFSEKYINEKSAECFDKLIRLDGYSVIQIKQAILNARGDPFWEQNFQSPSKLRDKDKNGVLFIDRFLKIKPYATNQQNLPKNQKPEGLGEFKSL